MRNAGRVVKREDLMSKVWDVNAPDLAAEVISPNDRYAEVDEKVAAWLESGTRLMLVVTPRRRTVAVHGSARRCAC